jgi:hypothetical protein
VEDVIGGVELVGGVEIAPLLNISSNSRRTRALFVSADIDAFLSVARRSLHDRLLFHKIQAGCSANIAHVGYFSEQEK